MADTGVKGAAAGAAAPDQWTEFQTPEGGTYYFNEGTGEMSWSRPAALGAGKAGRGRSETVVQNAVIEANIDRGHRFSIVGAPPPKA